jgi:hypothetical protein
MAPSVFLLYSFLMISIPFFLGKENPVVNSTGGALKKV